MHYDGGWHLGRKYPRQVNIVGGRARGRLLLADLKETNGQTSNGRLEAVV
jgi:hypothetical protein